MFIYLIFVITTCNIIYTEGGQCVWRGLCNTTQDNGPLYCKKIGPPEPIPDSPTLVKFVSVCPEYQNKIDPKNSLPVCCSPDQVEVFASSLQLAEMLLGKYDILFFAIFV